MSEPTDSGTLLFLRTLVLNSNATPGKIIIVAKSSALINK